MDRNQVAKCDGKARSAPKISEQHTFIHADYEIVIEHALIRHTGPLIIARLKPKDTRIGTLPTFVFRWDERDNHLDVDPVNVSEAETSQFKDGTGGYCGHHTVKFSSNLRTFAADIGWRAERIYQGQITFNLARNVKCDVAVGVSTSVSVISDKGIG
jgi:hypothetical protein